MLFFIDFLVHKICNIDINQIIIIRIYIYICIYIMNKYNIMKNIILINIINI